MYKILAIALLLISNPVSADFELTGRFSMLGSTSRAQQGDAGYVSQDKTLTADQQSLRLMLDGIADKTEWALHVKTLRLHVTGVPLSTTNSFDLFRVNPYTDLWINETSDTISTIAGYQLDRAFYQYRHENINLAIGRQPVDWGSGRFWQPLNIFGAFAPTDLDTDFKPGIDIARFDWFPTAFSSLTVAYVFSPSNHSIVKNKTSAAVYYRKQVGKESELLLLSGSVIGHSVIGAAFESSLGSIGYRFEAAQLNEYDSGKNSLSWIAGLDYQFENGTFISAELYNNSRGANNVNDVTALQNDALINYGLQTQLGKQVLGLSVNKDLTSLINGSYTLLVASLNQGSSNASVLHQLNLRYSVSNESDLLLSFLSATGEGLSGVTPRSEYGHLPTSISARLRFYF